MRGGLGDAPRSLAFGKLVQVCGQRGWEMFLVGLSRWEWGYSVVCVWGRVRGRSL